MPLLCRAALAYSTHFQVSRTLAVPLSIPKAAIPIVYDITSVPGISTTRYRAFNFEGPHNPDSNPNPKFTAEVDATCTHDSGNYPLHRATLRRGSRDAITNPTYLLLDARVMIPQRRGTLLMTASNFVGLRSCLIFVVSALKHSLSTPRCVHPSASSPQPDGRFITVPQLLLVDAMRAGLLTMVQQQHRRCSLGDATLQPHKNIGNGIRVI